MARNDHCVICDYSEQSGSGMIGVSPGKHGKVRRYAGDLLCDVCISSVGENLADMVRDAETETNNA